jgi:hypothetical protein
MGLASVREGKKTVTPISTPKSYTQRLAETNLVPSVRR